MSHLQKLTAFKRNLYKLDVKYFLFSALWFVFTFICIQTVCVLFACLLFVFVNPGDFVLDGDPALAIT